MNKKRLLLQFGLVSVAVAVSAVALVFLNSGSQDKTADLRLEGEKSLYRLAGEIVKGSTISVDGYAGFVREGTERATPGRKMVVFFDPLCKYCRTFWDASDGVDVHQTWVPVSILNQGESLNMSGWLLESAMGSANPSEQFSSMKQALEAGKRVEAHASEVHLQKVQANTKRFTDSGQQGVPTVAYLDENTDQIRVFRGAIGRDAIEKMIQEMALAPEQGLKAHDQLAAENP